MANLRGTSEWIDKIDVRFPATFSVRRIPSSSSLYSHWSGVTTKEAYTASKKAAHQVLSSSSISPIARMVCPCCDKEFEPDNWYSTATISGLRTFITCPYCSNQVGIDYPLADKADNTIPISTCGYSSASSSSSLSTAACGAALEVSLSHVLDVIKTLEENDVTLSKSIEEVYAQYERLSKIKVKHFETNDVYEIHKAIDKLGRRIDLIKSAQDALTRRDRIIVGLAGGITLLNLIVLGGILYRGF